MAKRLAIALGVFAFVSGSTAHAVTLSKDAAGCQAAVGKGLGGYKKAYVKAWEKCLDGDLKGKGCDTAARDDAIATAMTKATAAVTGKCTDALLFTGTPNGAGFAMNCHLETGETLEAPEAACDGLTVNDATSLVNCLKCWKNAELNEFLAILYACPTTPAIPAGSDLACGTAPVSCPAATDKVNVGCLTTIAKNGLKWLLAKEKAIEGCENKVRSGKLMPPCPDAATAAKLATAEQKAKDGITAKCPGLPPWWTQCPEKASDSASCTNITSVSDLRDCVVNSGEAIVDELVSQQYPPLCCGFSFGGPTQLRFEVSVGAGNCGTLTVSTGTVNLACGGLYFGGAGETVPLPAVIPDKGVYVTKVVSCAGTTLGLDVTQQTDPGVTIRSCTSPLGTCTPGGAGSCAGGACTGTGTCTAGTCTAGKTGKPCPGGNADCDFDCFDDSDCGVCTAGNVGLQCSKGNDHACSCLFGAPLPIPNTTLASASTCVVNSIGNLQGTLVYGTADCVSGAINLTVPLNSEVFLTGDLMLKRCNSASSNAGFNCLSTANCLGTDPMRACVADPTIQPCPVCNPTTNKCNGGPNEGAACTAGTSNLGKCSTAACTSPPTTSKTCRVGVAGDCGAGETCCALNFYPTSHDCPPPHTGGDIGGLPIPIPYVSDPATPATRNSFSTGTGNGKSNVFCPTCRDPNTGNFENPPRHCNCDKGQVCGGDGPCTTDPFTSCDQRNNGAFHDATASNITETGVPAGDLTDGAKHASNLAGIFCIPPAYDPTLTVDGNGDLPGPGAVSLPGQAQLLP